MQLSGFFRGLFGAGPEPSGAAREARSEIPRWRLEFGDVRRALVASASRSESAPPLRVRWRSGCDGPGRISLPGSIAGGWRSIRGWLAGLEAKVCYDHQPERAGGHRSRCNGPCARFGRGRGWPGESDLAPGGARSTLPHDWQLWRMGVWPKLVPCKQPLLSPHLSKPPLQPPGLAVPTNHPGRKPFRLHPRGERLLPRRSP